MQTESGGKNLDRLGNFRALAVLCTAMVRRGALLPSIDTDWLWARPRDVNGLARPVDPDEAYWKAVQGSRRWKLLRGVALITLLTVLGLLFAVRMERRGKAPTMRQWVPAGPNKVDYGAIHGELLPSWVAALNHRNCYGKCTVAEKSVSLLRGRDTDKAYVRLRSALNQDPNLCGLLDELRLSTLDVLSNAPRIRELMQAWNLYLRERELPWHVEHRIDKTPSGAVLTVRNYRIIATTPLSLSSRPATLLLGWREDANFWPLDTAHGYTSSSDPDVAMILAAPAAEFAMGEVWPLFADEGVSGWGGENTLVAKMKEEAQTVLDPIDYVLLKRTAMARRDLLGLAADMRHRDGCGSHPHFGSPPWLALPLRTLEGLRETAARNELMGCPRWTMMDAERMADLSDKLSERGLGEALTHLTGWVARAVAVHEAQHLADENGEALKAGSWECEGCPGALNSAERAELSAYLAAFSTPGIGYLAILQACGSSPTGSNPNRGAIGWVLPRLLPMGCFGEVPANLYERAGLLRRVLLGEGEHVSLPAEFPTSVPVQPPSRNPKQP